MAENTTCEDIKRSYDRGRLLALAEQMGLASRSGRMACPAKCSDDPRGCKVDDSSGGALWECKRCGKAGSVLDLVMLARGEDLHAALEFLGATPVPAPKPVAPVAPVDGRALWGRLASSDPAGEAYLKIRGLEAALPFVRFNVGSLPEDHSLPFEDRSKTPENFLNWAAGKSYRVALPLSDSAGIVRTFQLRAVGDPGLDTKGNKRANKLSLRGPSTTGTAFGDPAAAGLADVVAFAEGIADSLALLAAGQVVVGGSGTDQIAGLDGFVGNPRGRVCLLCPQNDTDPKVRLKSQDAFAELAKRLRDAGAIVRTLPTPKGLKDPADWLKRDGLEAFREAIARVVSGPKLVPKPKPEPASKPSKPEPETDGDLALVTDPEDEPRPLSRSYGSLCQILRTPALAKHLFGAAKLEYNEMLRVPTIGRRPVVDHDYGKIRERCEAKFQTRKKVGLKFSTADIEQAVDQVAREHTFSPVAEYLNGLVWDGKLRINAACGEWLMADMTRLNIAIVRCWFIAAVARALKPGCKVDNVLILVGPQGYGKSEVFRALAGSEYFSDSPIDISNKDAFGLLQRVWILEWAELESLKRARDSEMVKAFISSRVDTFRPSYGRVEQTFPRRAVIVGSSNEREILSDATGNRRHWIITIRERINVQYVREIRDQLWAEAVALFRRNTEWTGAAENEVVNPVEPWWLDDEMDADLAEVHLSHRQRDAWEDAILRFARSRKGPFKTSEVLEEAIQKPPGQWTKADEMRVGSILRGCGYNRERVTSLVDPDDRPWCWVAPEKPTDLPF